MSQFKLLDPNPMPAYRMRAVCSELLAVSSELTPSQRTSVSYVCNSLQQRADELDSSTRGVRNGEPAKRAIAQRQPMTAGAPLRADGRL